MPDWLSSVLPTIVVGVVSAVAVRALIDWRAGRNRRAVAAGRPATFDAWLRADARPYPKRWRYGFLSLGVGPPTWKPRFSILRRPIVLPPSAEVAKVRRTAGWIEPIVTNPGCVVIVARADGMTLELAVMNFELGTSLRALTAATGGGWRFPVPDPADDLIT